MIINKVNVLWLIFDNVKIGLQQNQVNKFFQNIYLFFSFSLSLFCVCNFQFVPPTVWRTIKEEKKKSFYSKNTEKKIISVQKIIPAYCKCYEEAVKWHFRSIKFPLSPPNVGNLDFIYIHMQFFVCMRD